jgi:hypothetical protein
VAFKSRWISLIERSFILCAGEDLPPLSSGDANEDCQWEVQIDEGWVSYWDS